MGGYFLNFIVYTTAMIGVIFLAVLAYKKLNFTTSSNSHMLSIEDSMNLAPRKNLYVVRVKNERFLIASDTEHTTLISKLGDSNNIQESNIDEEIDSTVDDLPVIVDFQKKKTNKTAQEVLKNIINAQV